MKLFIDDIRDPPDESWTIARSYEEAVRLVAVEFPEMVSFDHDLGSGPTGYDFAHHLVDRDLDNAAMPINFTFTVHSANPVGANNITGLLNRYLKWKLDKG